MALVHFQAAADRGYGESQLTVADFYAYGVTGLTKIRFSFALCKTCSQNYNEKKALDELLNIQSNYLETVTILLCKTHRKFHHLNINL